MIKGVFCLEPLTQEAVTQLVDTGVNTIALKYDYIDEKLVACLKHHQIKVYLDVNLFEHQQLWQRYPEARPCDKFGNLMNPIHWYYGVCPNRPEVRNEKLRLIESALAIDGIDGLLLDFIRYPCHWEEVKTPEITEYCFCSHCLKQFTHEVGGSPEGGDWIRWKCQQITRFVRDVRRRLDASKKPLTLGVCAVPWTERDFHGAIHTIIGQDFEAFAPYVDLFAPMTYHMLTEHSLDWIQEIVTYIMHLTGKPVMPFVQSFDNPTILSAHEFARSLDMAIQPPSSGVMIFHFEDLVAHSEKCVAAKQLFQKGNGECL